MPGVSFGRVFDWAAEPGLAPRPERSSHDLSTPPDFATSVPGRHVRLTNLGEPGRANGVRGSRNKRAFRTRPATGLGWDRGPVAARGCNV